ncbi:MAG: hypothetical protein WCC82_11160 [Nitrososphaeraceae archaeon]|jgi:hypothetical protein
MVTDDDTKDEALFRERYATELRKKKQQDSNTFRGDDELNDEKRKVNQQEMKTPGRRGEKIKQEELDREFSRRSMIKKEKKELNQNPKL